MMAGGPLGHEGDRTIPLGQLPWGQLPWGQLPLEQLPTGQLPFRATTPPITTHQLPGVSLTAPPSLSGNRGEYFRVLEILEMWVKKEGDISGILPISKSSRHQ